MRQQVFVFFTVCLTLFAGPVRKSFAQPPDPANLVEVTDASSIAPGIAFWSLQLTNFPPSPFDPFPGVTVYVDSTTGFYYYDDLSISFPTPWLSLFDWPHRHHHHSATSEGGIITADDDVPIPGGDGGDEDYVAPEVPPFIPPAPGFTNCQTYTNFWIYPEFSSTPSQFNGEISNTLPGLSYVILYKTNLTDTTWTPIQTVTATNSLTPFTVSTSDPNSLFFWAVLSNSVQAPVIVVPPTNEMAQSGGTALFTVVAEGNPALSYQWYLDGTNIAGATTSSLTVSSVSCAKAGLYTVIVTNVMCDASASAGLGVTWTNYLGAPIDASPAVDSFGNVYIATTGSTLYSLGACGHTNWSVAITTGENGDITSSPTLAPDGSAVYIGTQDSGGGYLDAFNPTNGSLLWQVSLGGAQANSTPAVASDGTIFVTTGNGSTNGLLSINPATHATNWLFQPDDYYNSGGSMDGSPAVGQDCSVYFVAGGDLFSVNASGQLNWFFPLPSGTAPVPSPAIDAHGNILAGDSDGVLYCLGANGGLLWLFNTGSAIQSSVALSADGTVFAATTAGTLFAISNGVQLWAYTNSDSAAFVSSPAVSADNVVVIGSEDDYVYGITNGAVKFAYATSGYVLSSPAISPVSGAIFAGSEDGSLYSLQGVAGLAESVWPSFHGGPAHAGAAPHAVCSSAALLTAFPNNPYFSTDGSHASFNFLLSGTPGTIWDILSSTNLVDWFPYNTVTMDSYWGIVSFTDTNIDGVTQRFYQARTATTCMPVIGFVNVTVPTGTNLVADQFHQVNDNDSPQNSAFGWLQFLQNNGFALPDGLQLWDWNGGGFIKETNLAVSVGWVPNGNNTLIAGQSEFLVNPASSFTVPFAGVVPFGTSTKAIAPGVNFVSSMIPMAGRVQSDLGYNPNAGDQVLLWNGTNYVTNTYSGAEWSPSEPSVNVAQGFVIVASQSNSWSQNFSPCESLLVVTANPLWTDSGVVISNGQTATFNCTGSWTGGASYCGPAGIAPGSDVFLGTVNQFGLVAFVGPNPYYWNSTNEWGNGAYFPQGASTNGYYGPTNSTGSNWVFTATRTGELWYGINDDAVSEKIDDNFGFLDGQLTITNSP